MSERMATGYKGVFYRLKTKPGSTTQKHKVYYIRYRIGGRDGKMIEEPVGTESEGFTPARASHARSERITGKALPNKERREAKAEAKRKEKEKHTFKKIWEQYQCREVSKQFVRGEVSYYSNHLEKEIGSKTPDQLKTKDIEELCNHMGEKGLAPQTVKHVLGVVKRMIKFAVERGMCEPPLEKNLRFTMPRVDNKKTENMTPEQFTSYIAALNEEPDQHAAAILRLALFTGMRKSAILALVWADIDFDRGFITLCGESAKKRKTEMIPMSNQARAVLEKLPHTPGTEFLFPGKSGGGREGITRMSRRVKEKAGLPKDFRPMHGLRHTFASWLASSGQVDLYTLQKLLTHESPDMTARYAHLADEALKRAATTAGTILDPEAVAARVNANK